MSVVATLIGAMRGHRPLQGLRFPAAQERRFVDATKEGRARHFLVSGWVALVTFNLFLVSDWMMVPDQFDLAWRLRLLVFTPPALITLFLLSRKTSLLLSLPPALIELVVVFSGVAAALCLVVVLVFTDSPYAPMYRGGLVPILVYGTLVQRFRFRVAASFAACVLLCHVASVWLAVGQPSPYPELEVPMLLLLAVIACYTLLMNRRMELEERHRFAQKERAAELRAELVASQAQLEALSRQDVLTGLPNRRAFDEVAQQAWSAQVASGGKLALLLIDVDHFKAYNDRHGHPAGDACLQQVALALQSAVAGAGASLARWGGEEFIVLLPQSDDQRGHELAEHLRLSVRQLALRHDASEAAPVVTISVGVAVARPAAVSLTVVMAAADAALYRAKRDGRDRSRVERVGDGV